MENVLIFLTLENLLNNRLCSDARKEKKHAFFGIEAYSTPKESQYPLCYGFIVLEKPLRTRTKTMHFLDLNLQSLTSATSLWFGIYFRIFLSEVGVSGFGFRVSRNIYLIRWGWGVFVFVDFDVLPQLPRFLSLGCKFMLFGFEFSIAFN